MKSHSKHWQRFRKERTEKILIYLLDWKAFPWVVYGVPGGYSKTSVRTGEGHRSRNAACFTPSRVSRTYAAKNHSSSSGQLWRWNKWTFQGTSDVDAPGPDTLAQDVLGFVLRKRALRAQSNPKEENVGVEPTGNITLHLTPSKIFSLNWSHYYCLWLSFFLSVQVISPHATFRTVHSTYSVTMNWYRYRIRSENTVSGQSSELWH